MVERITRRQFLVYGGAAAGLLALAACTPGSSKPTPTSAGSTGPTGQVDDLFHIDGLPDIEAAELVTDTSQYPMAFAERPEFAAMVEAGELPPVAERIGQDPLVMRPLDSIGTYGGEIRRAYTGTGDYKNASFFNSGPDTLFQWDLTRQHLTPWIAKDYELSDDGRELLVHLRRGMRWSDGEPFTADDILFWREDITLNPELPGLGASLNPEGKPVKVTKVDDYTVSYVSEDPYPMLPRLMATVSDLGGPAWIGEILDGGYMPKHYFSRFHPAYVGEQEAKRLAKDAGYPTWIAYMQYLNQWGLNPEMPTVSPWVTVRPLNDPPHTFGPNPYSIWVDTDGNQLPYIGDIHFELVQQEDVIVLKATEGEFDFVDLHINTPNLPVLLENQERSGYTLYQTPREDMAAQVRINLSFEDDPVVGELIRTLDFRRALSLGVVRDQVNEAFFLGTGTPTPTLPTSYNQYFPCADYRTMWATPDRTQALSEANALLDGIGLTDKDDEGFRLRPDGAGRIRVNYDAYWPTDVEIGEMIKQQWSEIGIDTNVALNTNPTLGNNNELTLFGIGGGTDDPFLNPGSFLPVVNNFYAGTFSIPYSLWFTSNGEKGEKPPASLFEPLNQAVEIYYEGLRTVDDEQRNEMGKELFRLHVDNVWTIGVVGYGVGTYGMYLANDDLKNVPRRILSTNHQFSPENTFPMTFFY
jgi:peptide/nickel transport system substrate-binding protein